MEAPSLRVGVEATAGKRGADRMEDAHTLGSYGGVCLAAVYDGHGGDAAARYSSTQLPAALLRCWPRGADGQLDPSGGKDALSKAFVSLNDGFLASPAADDSGCTALAALCLPMEVLLANAGDCQCCVWREGDELVTLNTEHIAADERERARVEAAGAEVKQTADGKMRVQGIIQVTRCIGDRKLRKFGLISEPEITVVPKQPTDQALVLASDGMWDVLTKAHVLHCLKNTAKSPDMIAKRLVTEAMDRGTKDNVTVLVVFLKDLSHLV